MINNFLKKIDISNHQDLIISNIYIGNYESSIDNNFLEKNKIKLIINCTKHLKFNNNFNDVKHQIREYKKSKIIKFLFLNKLRYQISLIKLKKKIDNDFSEEKIIFKKLLYQMKNFLNKNNSDLIFKLTSASPMTLISALLIFSVVIDFNSAFPSA